MPRKTAQREALSRVFIEHSRPLRVEEVLEYGRREIASLDQATVYRNLKRLTQEGWILKLRHPDLGTLYERSGKGHHHHFYCRVCDRLLELPGCALDEKREIPPGFSCEGHELVLHGVCDACSSRKSKAERKSPARKSSPPHM
ncbi:MAG: transcriptional repressor [Planctomycetota bacterium]